MAHTGTAIGTDVVNNAAASSAHAALLTEHEFQALYRLHARALWGYLFRVTGNAADADDLLQDSFCRLLATPVATRDDAELRAYLYRIASNVAIDHWRRGSRRGTTQALDTAAEQVAATAPDHGDAAAMRRDVSKTLRELKPQDRVMLWLAHVEGIGHREIADAVGVKAASVPVLLHRARRKLADLLRKKGLGPGER